MPRKRLETKISIIAKMLIEEFHPKNAQDIQEALKDLLGDTMEKLLKAELDKIQLKDKFQKELDD